MQVIRDKFCNFFKIYIVSKCLVDVKATAICSTFRTNNVDVAGQRKTIVRKAAQFITQPLFFHESFFASNSSGEVRRNKERKKER